MGFIEAQGKRQLHGSRAFVVAFLQELVPSRLPVGEELARVQRRGPGQQQQQQQQQRRRRRRRQRGPLVRPVPPHALSALGCPTAERVPAAPTSPLAPACWPPTWIPAGSRAGRDSGPSQSADWLRPWPRDQSPALRKFDSGHHIWFSFKFSKAVVNGPAGLAG